MESVAEYLAKIGRKGGKARLRTMTPAERSAIALKASRAAARVRSQKAEAKKSIRKISKRSS